VRRCAFDYLGGVVQFGAGDADGMVELAAFARPVGIHPPQSARTDDPARVRRGVVEQLEHGLG